MNDSVLVNQVYLIFNRPQFLVDSSDCIIILQIPLSAKNGPELNVGGINYEKE